MGSLTCSLVAWFVLAQVPPSQPPPPTPLEAGRNEQEHRAVEAPKPHGNDGPTKPDSPVLLQDNPEPGGGSQKNEGAPKQELPASIGARFWEWLWRDVHNTLMVLFNGILAVVTYLQWRILRTQKQTTRQELRAYVFLDYPMTKHAELADGHSFDLIVKNTGATPAHNVRISTGLLINDFPYHGAFELREPNSWFVLAPDAWVRQELRARLTPEQKELLRNGKIVIFVYGRIEYVDVFKQAQWATFRAQFGGDTFTDGMTFTKEGNQASN